MHHRYFVTGIDTGIGKTIVSAILALATAATYWKPIQSGDLDKSDSMLVKRLTRNKVNILPEAVKLKHPLSPHAAAFMEKRSIGLENFKQELPKGNLIVEGAGGLMVPFNNNELILDLIKQLNLEVILVSKNYLGSINHTLMSLEVLKSRAINIKGVLFNGETNELTEEVILKYTGVKCLGRIPNAENLDEAFIEEMALQMKNSL